MRKRISGKQMGQELKTKASDLSDLSISAIHIMGSLDRNEYFEHERDLITDFPSQSIESINSYRPATEGGFQPQQQCAYSKKDRICQATSSTSNETKKSILQKPQQQLDQNSSPPKQSMSENKIQTAKAVISAPVMQIHFHRNKSPFSMKSQSKKDGQYKKQATKQKDDYEMSNRSSEDIKSAQPISIKVMGAATAIRIQNKGMFIPSYVNNKISMNKDSLGKIYHLLPNDYTNAVYDINSKLPEVQDPPSGHVIVNNKDTNRLNVKYLWRSRQEGVEGRKEGGFGKSSTKVSSSCDTVFHNTAMLTSLEYRTVLETATHSFIHKLPKYVSSTGNFEALLTAAKNLHGIKPVTSPYNLVTLTTM